MADLSAAYDRPSRNAGGIIEYGMADTAGNNIYKGAFVLFDVTGSGGNILIGSDLSGGVFAGVAAETVLQPADPGAEGTNKVKVYTKGDFLVTYDGTLAVTDIGKNVALDGDNQVDLLSGLTNDVECGFIVDREDAATAWVRINRVNPISSAS